MLLRMNTIRTLSIQYVWVGCILDLALDYHIFVITDGQLVLATQSIESLARQKGRASLYDWIVYKRESKAREWKGEEQQHRSTFYAILESRELT